VRLAEVREGSKSPWETPDSRESAFFEDGRGELYTRYQGNQKEKENGRRAEIVKKRKKRAFTPLH